ncbi:MAG: NUDIX domain-containing protein [Nanoarchaeota archaeon]|nr:NUDIX domain-containing protein [Nanoarchaeota archaeon]
MEEFVKKGIYVILYDVLDGSINYVILKRKEGWIGWEILKGGIKDNEDINDTAKRETLEEVSLTVDVVKSTEQSIFFSEKDGKRIRHEMIGTFFAKVLNHNLILSDEHSEFRFVNLDEALEMLSFDDVKTLLVKVDKEIRKYEGL